MTDFYVNRQTKYCVAKLRNPEGLSKVMKERENINAQIVALNVSLCLCKKTSLNSFLTKKRDAKCNAKGN